MEGGVGESRRWNKALFRRWLEGSLRKRQRNVSPVPGKKTNIPEGLIFPGARTRTGFTGLFARAQTFFFTAAILFMTSKRLLAVVLGAVLALGRGALGGVPYPFPAQSGLSAHGLESGARKHPRSKLRGIRQTHARSKIPPPILVAASASEWSAIRSLALAATPTKPEQAPGYLTQRE